MSKAQIVPPAGGGGGMVGFEMLWEGDLHLTQPTVEDITEGAVDLSGYQVVLIRYYGTATNSDTNTNHDGAWFGLFGATASSHDGIVSVKKTETIDITHLICPKNSGSFSGYWGGVNRSGHNPLKFCMKNTYVLTCDFHFIIYGMKL